MESDNATDETRESKRLICSIAGGGGGILSALITFAFAHVPEISWHLVHGWSEALPWSVDSSTEGFRFALGIILGVAFGAAERSRPRFAFWMGAGMSFLVCYLIVPDPMRIRE